MAETGTEIERFGNGTLERGDDAADVEVIPVDVTSTEKAAIIRDTHAQRTDLAGRVLSLLTSLGDLALRILEQRAHTVTENAGSAVAASTSARQGTVEQRSTRRVTAEGQRRRRRRHRGGA